MPATAAIVVSLGRSGKGGAGYVVGFVEGRRLRGLLGELSGLLARHGS